MICADYVILTIIGLITVIKRVGHILYIGKLAQFNLLFMLYSYMPYPNNTIIKTQEDFFNKICTSHFIARVRKGYSRFACERELETKQKLQYFDTYSYGRQHCVFLVLLMLNWRPWGPLCWVLAFFTASYQQLLWSPNSIGGSWGPPRLGVAFPTTSRL